MCKLSLGAHQTSPHPPNPHACSYALCPSVLDYSFFWNGVMSYDVGGDDDRDHAYAYSYAHDDACALVHWHWLLLMLLELIEAIRLLPS